MSMYGCHELTADRYVSCQALLCVKMRISLPDLSVPACNHNLYKAFASHTTFYSNCLSLDNLSLRLFRINMPEYFYRQVRLNHAKLGNYENHIMCVRLTRPVDIEYKNGMLISRPNKIRKMGLSLFDTFDTDKWLRRTSSDKQEIGECFTAIAVKCSLISLF